MQITTFKTKDKIKNINELKGSKYVSFIIKNPKKYSEKMYLELFKEVIYKLNLGGRRKKLDNSHKIE